MTRTACAHSTPVWSRLAHMANTHGPLSELAHGEHREQGFDLSYFLASVKLLFDLHSPLTPLPSFGMIAQRSSHGDYFSWIMHHVLVVSTCLCWCTSCQSMDHFWSHWPRELNFSIEVCLGMVWVASVTAPRVQFCGFCQGSQKVRLSLHFLQSCRFLLAYKHVFIRRHFPAL